MTDAERLAELVSERWRELERVMGDEWIAARAEELELKISLVDDYPVVTWVWDRGTNAEHSASIIAPGTVLETRRAPNGDLEALTWNVDESGARTIVAIARMEESHGEEQPPNPA